MKRSCRRKLNYFYVTKNQQQTKETELQLKDILVGANLLLYDK